MSDSLAHANHNCDTHALLAATPGHEDWVVTLAFYASLHFLRHKLFPFEFHQKETIYNCDTFDYYYTVLSHRVGKHGAMRALVETQCPRPVSIAYNRLMDMCFNARYNQYDVSKDAADLASARMHLIKEFATT
jgi:hypothetical protein